MVREQPPNLHQRNHERFSELFAEDPKTIFYGSMDYIEGFFGQHYSVALWASASIDTEKASSIVGPQSPLWARNK